MQRVTSISIETSFGIVGVEASDAGVRRVRLPGEPRPGATGAADVGSVARRAADQIAEYAEGEREQFELPLDWSGVDDVHRRVLETLRELAPYGVTVTYGELGRASGVEDPRDVGVLMARNPLPLVVPCHRVVAADGLGGFGGGIELKQRLLELEGVLPARLELSV